MRRFWASRLLPPNYFPKLLLALPVLLICYEGAAIVATAALHLDPERAAAGFAALALATWLGLLAICVARLNPDPSREGDARRVAAAAALAVALCLAATAFCGRYTNVMPEIFGKSWLAISALIVVWAFFYFHRAALRRLPRGNSSQRSNGPN